VKITLIGVNFYPEDSAIGLYSTQMAESLAAYGHEISVITGAPYYPQWKIADAYKKKPRFLKETYGSMNLFRYKQYTPAKPSFLKRVIHIIDFTIGSYFNQRKIKQCDLVISIVPFTSSAYLGNIHKKRFNIPHWIHIQDFEFDAAFQSGLIQSKKEKKSFIYKALMKLEKRIFSKADRISTISQTMLTKLEGKSTSQRYFLPNWIDEDAINPSKSKQHPYLSSNKFKILYSGNIGDKQDWDFFNALIKQLDFSRFEVIIVGDGAKRVQLAGIIENYTGIKFHLPVAYSALSDLLCSADAHILFQKEEVIDTVMPSKILGMMASAKPSIITGHLDSEVKKIIENSKGGFYFSNNSLSNVINQLNILSTNSQKANEIGLQARNYVVNHFSKDKILQDFVNELKKL